jgi:hypothetical protein
MLPRATGRAVIRGSRPPDLKRKIIFSIDSAAQQLQVQHYIYSISGRYLSNWRQVKHSSSLALNL